ncbi:hypothetical protein [Pseudonocardia alaniniphila]|uniref:RiboL-PSP-HEPN domain-containing protein n=1 Tax=Pseudonocardia alaniniphila TaxID=75291 RepID=A0ABS9TJG7_9PSEU|nr:hypothetical protein [Pseudonocardia alaniniphila]MCH6168671.1 hypothetical protein [Pseudonocardia alaniniphila]
MPIISAHPPLPDDAIAGSDVLRKARQMQYPIARAARALQRAQEPKEQYEALLEAADALSVTLGATAAAWLRAGGGDDAGLAQLRTAYERGVTQGTWNSITRRASAVSGAGAAFPGMPAGAAAKKLQVHLAELVKERNLWAHGSAPRTGAEAAQRLERLLPVLEGALERAAFLVDVPWVLTQSSSYNVRTRQFEVIASDAMADHPEFERRRLTSAVPLADDRFYVLVRDQEPLDLTPFIVYRPCEICRHAEVFYADRLPDGSSTVLKSFASGHKIIDSTLDEDIRMLCGPMDSQSTES